MLLWPAFLLGFLGSLHCVGMCGPLMLALPASGRSRWMFLFGRLLNNGGRLVTYVSLGAIFGAFGHSLALAGLQRWVAVAAGVAVLVSVLGSSRLSLGLPMSKLVGYIKTAFGSLLHRKSFSSLFFLGMINGLLPCGLVYVAVAGAIAAHGPLQGAEHMLAFGLGTVPMMFGLSVGGRKILLRFGPTARRWMPAALVVIAMLLIVRGLALGIPYLSPSWDGSCCVKP